MNDLAQALMVAIRVHSGAVDKQGEPYLLHVLRVVEAVDNERAKILAALHDVVEDGEINPRIFEEIFEENGMFIANSVEILSRDPNETYIEYILNILDGHSSTWAAEIREVKLADLKDNLERIPPRPENEMGSLHLCARWDSQWKSLVPRYEKAIKVLNESM